MQSTGHNIELTANKITFCYDDLGNGKVPLIFIHGFPFDKSMWEPQVNYLSEFYRVIAYDIRGFGRSLKDDTEASINLYADDLMLFMDVLQIEKAVICGLSMGGYIALRAVYKYPKRFTGLILSDTQCISDSAEGKEKRYNTIKQIEAEGTAGFAEDFLKNVFTADSLENKKETTERIKNTILSNSSQTITQALAALAGRRESCSTLSAIAIPTLILCGREDHITPITQSQFMKENIKNSKLKIIDRAAHLSNLEQPDVFNEHVHDFLSSFLLYVSF
jgi:3-oxoadipate enol-lactonase